MLEDGVKGIGKEEDFRVMELIELVEEAMGLTASANSEGEAAPQPQKA